MKEDFWLAICKLNRFLIFICELTGSERQTWKASHEKVIVSLLNASLNSILSITRGAFCIREPDKVCYCPRLAQRRTFCYYGTNWLLIARTSTLISLEAPPLVPVLSPLNPPFWQRHPYSERFCTEHVAAIFLNARLCILSISVCTAILYFAGFISVIRFFGFRMHLLSAYTSGKPIETTCKRRFCADFALYRIHL